VKRTYRCIIEQLLARSVQVPGPLDTDCWMWMGAPDSNGYARLTMRQAGRANPVRVCVHRVAFEAFNDTTLGDAMTVHHRCYLRVCINPAHLDEVTNMDNLKMRRKPAWR
jgi:hypothetical protein